MSHAPHLFQLLVAILQSLNSVFSIIATPMLLHLLHYLALEVMRSNKNNCFIKLLMHKTVNLSFLYLFIRSSQVQYIIPKILVLSVIK